MNGVVCRYGMEQMLGGEFLDELIEALTKMDREQRLAEMEADVTATATIANKKTSK